MLIMFISLEEVLSKKIVDGAWSCSLENTYLVIGFRSSNALLVFVLKKRVFEFVTIIKMQCVACLQPDRVEKSFRYMPKGLPVRKSCKISLFVDQRYLLLNIHLIYKLNQGDVDFVEI